MSFFCPSKIMVNSSSVAPISRCFPLPTPNAMDSSVGRFITVPSTTGPKGRSPLAILRSSAMLAPPILLCASSIADSGTASKASRDAGTPRAAPIFFAVVRASASGIPTRAPDTEMARWNSGCADSMPSKVSTAPPPADWPAIVTFPGSPPKAAILSCTHRSAASQSRTPRFCGAPSTHPKPMKPKR